MPVAARARRAGEAPRRQHGVVQKKDLRITDHQPLAAAAREGPAVCLLIPKTDF